MQFGIERKALVCVRLSNQNRCYNLHGLRMHRLQHTLAESKELVNPTLTRQAGRCKGCAEWLCQLIFIFQGATCHAFVS